MKRYIRSAHETFEGIYNYHYGPSHKPDSRAITEVLGDSISDMKVFRVTVFEPGDSSEIKFQSCFVGRVPQRTNINLFGEWSWNVVDVLGVTISDSTSDDQIVQDTNNALMQIIDSPVSQYLIDVVGVDPMSEPWSISVGTLNIGDPTTYSAYKSEIYKGIFKLHPDVSIVSELIEDDSVILDDDFTRTFSNEVKLAREIIAEQHRESKIRETPYPYDADNAIVDAVHELNRFLSKINPSDSLEQTEQFIRSRSVENRRSPRYNNSRVADQITMLFDWANDNGLSTAEFKSACNKIYTKSLLRG